MVSQIESFRDESARLRVALDQRSQELKRTERALQQANHETRLANQAIDKIRTQLAGAPVTQEILDAAVSRAEKAEEDGKTVQRERSILQDKLDAAWHKLEKLERQPLSPARYNLVSRDKLAAAERKVAKLEQDLSDYQSMLRMERGKTLIQSVTRWCLDMERGTSVKDLTVGRDLLIRMLQQWDQ